MTEIKYIKFANELVKKIKNIDGLVNIEKYFF